MWKVLHEAAHACTQLCRLRQEDHVFKASLGYRTKLCLKTQGKKCGDEEINDVLREQ